MDTIKLDNTTDLEFINIVGEKYRTYHYPEGNTITIEDPAYYAVTKSGSHRVLTNTGECNWIKGGFDRISWKVHDGFSHFVA